MLQDMKSISIRGEICVTEPGELIQPKRTDVSFQVKKNLAKRVKLNHGSTVRANPLCFSPQKEIVVVVFGDTIGEAGKVSQASYIKPRSSWDLQHAAPRLVAQQLDLGREEQVGVVLPRQVVVHTVGLLVQSQDLGKHYDLCQLCSARLSLRSPVVGQLTSPAPCRTSPCQDKRHNNPHHPGSKRKKKSRTQWKKKSCRGLTQCTYSKNSVKSQRVHLKKDVEQWNSSRVSVTPLLSEFLLPPPPPAAASIPADQWDQPIHISSIPCWNCVSLRLMGAQVV